MRDPEFCDRVVAMYLSGMSCPVIAAETHTSRSVPYNILKARGIPTRRKRLSPAKIVAIALDRGSFRAVAGRHMVAVSTVQRLRNNFFVKK